MLFNKIGKIYSLLIGNEMESCKKDTEIMKSLFLNFKGESKVCINVDPKDEINKFCNRDFNSEDLLIIHYSGHGNIKGKKKAGQIFIASTWIFKEKETFSHDIDFILSKLNCQILLISDSCHSENFGNFYTGKSSLVFIGSSSINHISKEYEIKSKEKTGALSRLFEEMLENRFIDEISIEEFKEITKKFFYRNRIKIKPVIKILGYRI